jgi:hypothetical protein
MLPVMLGSSARRSAPPAPPADTPLLYASDGGTRGGAEQARSSWRPRSLAMKRRQLRLCGYHVVVIRSSEWPAMGTLGDKERAIVHALLEIIKRSPPIPPISWPRLR